METDAVGRPSALPHRGNEPDPPRKPVQLKKTISLPIIEEDEAPNTIETDDHLPTVSDLTPKENAFGKDEIIIGALLLSLLDGNRERNEDITMLILLLLLIF